MRPINLLPQKHRPRAATGDRAGSAYFAIGGLALLLIGLLLYVVSANQATSRNDELARTKAETEQAKARSASLSSFGNFSSIKETRLNSVKQLAAVRFDWERATREIARVLPTGTSLTTLEASVTGATGGTSPAADAGEGPKSPTMALSGCARSHPEVATTLVRLRRMNRAEEVDLSESTRNDTEAGAAASSGGPTTGGCGDKQKISFKAVVTFSVAPSPSDAPGARVPAALGGGS